MILGTIGAKNTTCAALRHVLQIHRPCDMVSLCFHPGTTYGTMAHLHVVSIKHDPKNILLAFLARDIKNIFFESFNDLYNPFEN